MCFNKKDYGDLNLAEQPAPPSHAHLAKPPPICQVRMRMDSRGPFGVGVGGVGFRGVAYPRKHEHILSQPWRLILDSIGPKGAGSGAWPFFKDPQLGAASAGIDVRLGFPRHYLLPDRPKGDWH